MDLLLLPVHAPWSKISEVVDYGRAVGAPLSVGIHDGLLNDRGLGLAQRQLSSMLGEREQEYLRLTSGEDVPLS